MSRYDNYERDITMVNVTTLNQTITGFLTGYKNSAKTLQKILEDFIESYNLPDGLNKNSTPLDRLLKGLRKTDSALVKLYIAEVTNAKLYLNAKGNYTLKIDGEALETNDKYGTISWNNMEKTVTVVQNDYYKSMTEALKATEKTLAKAIKTARTAEELTELKNKINELLTAQN